MSSKSDSPRHIDNNHEELLEEVIDKAERTPASAAADLSNNPMHDLYGSALASPATMNSDSGQPTASEHVLSTEARSISPPTTKRLTQTSKSSSLGKLFDFESDDDDDAEQKFRSSSSIVSSSAGSLSTTERFDDEASRSSNSMQQPIDHKQMEAFHNKYTPERPIKTIPNAETNTSATQDSLEKDESPTPQTENTEKEEEIVDYPDFLDSSSDSDDDSLIGDYALPGRMNDSSSAPPPVADPYPTRKPRSSSTTSIFSMGSAYDQIFCRFGLTPGATPTDEEYAKQDFSPGRTSKSGSSSVPGVDEELGVGGENNDARSLEHKSTSYQGVLSNRVCGGFLRLDLLLLIVVIVVVAIMIIAITAAVLRNST